MQPCYSGHYGGWIVLTRYKHRGCTSSAIHVGDFFPPRPVTLSLVERFIRREEWDGDDEDNPMTQPNGNDQSKSSSSPSSPVSVPPEHKGKQ